MDELEKFKRNIEALGIPTPTPAAPSGHSLNWRTWDHTHIRTSDWSRSYDPPGDASRFLARDDRALEQRQFQGSREEDGREGEGTDARRRLRSRDAGEFVELLRRHAARDRKRKKRQRARDARSIALDASYFANQRLSNLIDATPEGYLICRSACIGRSGFQTYKVSELADPNGLLEGYGPNEDVKVWRDPSEVFSPATLASFEAKTFCLSHPDELLDPDSEQRHHEGHLQNVRKGPEPLDSGDWPLLADIIVTGRDAIEAIADGARELSCGYSYKLASSGGRLEQRSILGNHVSLVQSGRAGSEARIYDSVR